MIEARLKGNTKKLDNFFERLLEGVNIGKLDKYGKQGVQALMNATPVDTGLTKYSWYYTITNEKGNVRLSFHNSHINNGVNIALILQYGHATRNGGWVEGIDYINPALQPIFQKLADEAWKEVVG